MKFQEFETLISAPRIARYGIACLNNRGRTMCLYRRNIRLSQSFLAILSIFEIVLRNKIDQHYKLQFPSTAGSIEWLLASIRPGGFLTSPGCRRSFILVNKKYNELGSRYTHDKLIAELSLGFWKYLFAGNQYRAAGNTLLAVFPNIPSRHSQSHVYQRLDKINAIRNRVAHHEPICFNRGNNVISTLYAREHFQEVLDLLQWMNINSRRLFFGLNNVLKEANYIDRI